MILTGDALAATARDLARAKRGYRGKLLGYLDYDRKSQTFTRFDLVAVGENWCKEKRVGDLPERLTVGVAFELVPVHSGFQAVFPAFVLYTADYKEYLGQAGGQSTEPPSPLVVCVDRAASPAMTAQSPSRTSQSLLRFQA